MQELDRIKNKVMDLLESDEIDTEMMIAFCSNIVSYTLPLIDCSEEQVGNFYKKLDEQLLIFIKNKELINKNAVRLEK